MAENGVGGRALESWLRITGDSFEQAERDASAIATTDVLYLPWLTGSLAPSSDIRTRGGFVNLGTETTRAEMTRAVYEGVALNAAWLLPHVAALAGQQWDAVRFGGGGASSPFWAQVLADALGVRVDRLARPRTTNARGAAFLALAQLGHLAIDDIPNLVDVAQAHEPDAAAHERATARLEHFIDFHERNRGFYAALNRRR
jgi:xylulokinase